MSVTPGQAGTILGFPFNWRRRVQPFLVLATATASIMQCLSAPLLDFWHHWQVAGGILFPLALSAIWSLLDYAFKLLLRLTAHGQVFNCHGLCATAIVTSGAL